MIAGSYGFLADYLPEAAAKAIFGGGDALVAGTPAPTGQADRIPVVTMSWVTGHSEVAATTGSGCHNANWMVVSCRVPGRGPEPAQGSPPEVRLFLLAGEGMSDSRLVVHRWIAWHRESRFRDRACASRGRLLLPFVAFLSGPEERTTTGYPQPFFLRHCSADHRRRLPRHRQRCHRFFP